MKKYNLSKIMKRAWEIKKEHEGNIFALCLKMAWKEAKNPATIVTMCVVGKETITVDTKTGNVTGKTYNSRKFLKDNFKATWDGMTWTVDVDKFNTELNSYPEYYKKYIVSSAKVKTVSFKKLVNRADGFYSYIQYTDGTSEYAFVG